MKQNINKNSQYLVITSHFPGPWSNNLHVSFHLVLWDLHMLALSTKEDIDAYRG